MNLALPEDFVCMLSSSLLMYLSDCCKRFCNAINLTWCMVCSVEDVFGLDLVVERCFEACLTVKNKGRKEAFGKKFS